MRINVTIIAILFETQEPLARYAVVGLITEIKARNRPDRLKKADQARQATPEFSREVILSKCNAITYEVALLRGLALALLQQPATQRARNSLYARYSNSNDPGKKGCTAVTLDHTAEHVFNP